MIKLKRGLDIPLSGEPASCTGEEKTPEKIGVIGVDYIGMKPTMAVAIGDKVKLGQTLFTDKKNEGVRFTAPAAGQVIEINRGPRRILESVVIKRDDSIGEIHFSQYDSREFISLEREAVVTNLVQSGMWIAFRTRPFSKSPAIDAIPHSIFVTAMDTNPLAASPAPTIWENEKSWKNGLKILTRLTDGNVHVCAADGEALPLIKEVKNQIFAGPHPAGLPGTHIHFIDPVGLEKSVWHIGYQDVIAIGQLFATGKLHTERTIAIAGPMAQKPRIIKTCLGADLNELLRDEIKSGDVRIISGSVLSGHMASDTLAYLGRFHSQISLIEEGGIREFLGWLAPGKNKYSAKPLYASACRKKTKRFSLSTLLGGSHRAIFPTGAFEKVMPLDILPTYLVRALAAMDTEESQNLGCLELDEEDLALLSFVDCGKNDYGRLLREALTLIEKEG